MKCRICKRDIPDNSIFCSWCGKEQKRNRTVINVPKPYQKADGTWTAQLMIKGRRVYVPPQPTEAKYYAAARLLKAETKEQKSTIEDMTLADAIDKYKESRKSRLKSTSFDNYDYIKRCRFKSLMKMKIADITSDDVDEAVATELTLKSRKGGTISPDTVCDAYNLVATVLAKYAKLELDVSLPEIQRKFPVILTPEQIYPAVKGTDMELPALLAMWLGMSASEIRGLTKSKSIRGDKLYIVETVVRDSTGDVRRQGGKEETRPRVYDIPPYLKKLLDSVEGDIIEPRSAHRLNQRLQVLIAAAGLPKITFHSLRHTSASVMAEEKIPDKYAQERGGWKTDEVMKKTYQHTFDEGRLEADKVINKRFEALLE